MTIEQYISSLKNLQDITKIYFQLFLETNKHEKYFRKRFKKKEIKNIESRFWNTLKIFDEDLKERYNPKKDNVKKPTIKDIENLEKEVKQTKIGLLNFFTKIEESKSENISSNTDIQLPNGFVSKTKEEETSSVETTEKQNK